MFGTTTLTNDTIRITFNANNTANANLLTLGTHTVQVTTGTNITDSASNTANTTPAAVTITTEGVAPTITARETADLDNDGSIDAIKLTFSEAILDSTVQASDFDVSGVAGEAFSSTTAGDTADNTVIYLTFTDGVHNTGVTPTLAYTQSGATDVTDLAGNKLANSAATATTDKAKPVLLSTTSNVASGGDLFNAVNEQLDLVFSEALSAAPSEANLEAALTFAGGATDSDNLPSTGTGTNPIALATTTVTNDTIRVTFNANNTANANLLTVGTHTVQVTTGTNITDSASNTANTTPAAVTIQASSIRSPRHSGSSGYPAIY